MHAWPCWPIREGSLSCLQFRLQSIALGSSRELGPNRPRLDNSIRLDSTSAGQRLYRTVFPGSSPALRPPCQPRHAHPIASPWSLPCCCAVLVLLGVACRRRSLLLCDTFRFQFDSPLTDASSTNRHPTKVRADHRAAVRQGRIAQSSLVLVCRWQIPPRQAASSHRAVTQFGPRDLQLLGVPLHQNLPQHFHTLLEAGIASALMDNATKLASFMYVACQNNIAQHHRPLPTVPRLPSAVRRPPVPVTRTGRS